MIYYDLKNVGKALLTVGAILSFPAPQLGLGLVIVGVILLGCSRLVDRPPGEAE